METERELYAQMICITRFHQLDMAKRLQPYGVGMGQFGMLLRVCARPGIRQDDLAQAVLLNKSTVARGVAQLEQNGFLTRRRSEEDRRVYQLYPTDKALASLDELKTISLQCAERSTAMLSKAETDQLLALLRRIAVSCEGADRRCDCEHPPRRKRQYGNKHRG